MSLNMECYNLQHMIKDEDSVRSLLLLAAKSGKKILAYSGIYNNKYYECLQIVVGEVINYETKSLEIQSAHTHNTGNSFWKCRVIQEINPKGNGELDMRLLVEPVNGEKCMTVIDVLNADILPSFAPGEIIELQMVAKARSVNFYPDEAAFDQAEGQKASNPMSMDGKREERVMSLGAGFPMPSGYLQNHTVKDGDDRKAIPNTDDDKWVYLRGPMLRKLGYYLCLMPGRGGGMKRVPLAGTCINTYFGKIHIMYNFYGLTSEQQDLIEPGYTVSAVCEIQGDALINEYEEGMVINKKNNLMAVRYALSSGRFARLLPILSENCTLCCEADNETISGSGSIVEYLADKYGHLSVADKMHTLYGVVINSDEEIAENNMDRKTGDRCVLFGTSSDADDQYDQYAFLDFDEDEMICGIRISNNRHYRTLIYRSWVEMEEDEMKRKGISLAVLRKERILADYLNRADDHDMVKTVLCSILDCDIELGYGTQHYKGMEKVLEFLETTSLAISTDTGFKARPVFISIAGEMKKAVALCSKLEEYVSWYFFLDLNVETGKIEMIRGKRGQEFTHSIDFFEERDIDYSDLIALEEI